MPLFGIGVFLLWFFILNLVRLGNKNHILSVPLLAEQDVEFQEAGRVFLCVEGPLFTTRFGKLSYELTGSDGISMQGRRCWLRAQSTSLSRRVRMQLRSFDITHPGRYLLRIKGLASPQADDAEHRITFTKPHLPQTMAGILGIVLGGLLTIGSLVLFVLRFTSKGDSA